MLGIIDFRRVPNFTQVNKNTAQKPYFEDFMNAFQRQSQPTINEPPIWLWICRSNEAEIQVSTFVHKSMFTDVYKIKYANYWPASNERLEDCAANNKLAWSAAYLIFLIWKSYKASRPDLIIIPKAFIALQTSMYSKPRKYNKFEYQINNLELRMEFYLWILEMFYKPGDNILSIFGSKKVLCQGLISFCEFLLLIRGVLARIEVISLYRKLDYLSGHPL